MKSIKVAQYYFYPTMTCSLDCNHCFIEPRIRNSKSTMTIDEFKIIVDKYAEHFYSSNAQNAELTIMGGEPTLLNRGFYDEVMPYMREKFKSDNDNKNAYITLMTNFMHLAKVRNIENHFDFINTSYEPSRFGTQAKMQAWEDNVCQWIGERRKLVLSFTTTKEVIEAGTSLFDKFYDLGFRVFRINNLVPNGGALESNLGEDLYEKHLSNNIANQQKAVRKRKVFLASNTIYPSFSDESAYFTLITEWLLNKRKLDPSVVIDPIHSMIAELYAGIEISDLTCAMENGFSARPDGTVTGCASEIGNSNPINYGNIYTDSLSDIMTCDARVNSLAANQRYHKTCISCEFLRHCNGGCHQRARIWKEGDGDCHGMSNYLRYLSDNRDRLEELADLNYESV